MIYNIFWYSDCFWFIKFKIIFSKGVCKVRYCWCLECSRALFDVSQVWECLNTNIKTLSLMSGGIFQIVEVCCKQYLHPIIPKQFRTQYTLNVPWKSKWFNFPSSIDWSTNTFYFYHFYQFFTIKNSQFEGHLQL